MSSLAMPGCVIGIGRYGYPLGAPLHILTKGLNQQVDSNTDDMSIPMTYAQYSPFRGR